MAKKIVIDPGHGGSDPGASGNGIVEKDLTLKISKYMKDRFDDLGIESALTRDSDVSLSPNDRPIKVQSLYGSGDDVIVIGGGTMGMLHVLCAKKQGARVILSETDAARRKFGLELGADIVINPLESDPVEQVKALTNGRGANMVFNTTAIPTVAAQAIEMTAKSGYCNMFSSIHPNDPILVNAGRLHSQEIYVTGTQNGTIETFQRAIDCISKRIIDVRPLIDKKFKPEEVTEAMEYASRPDTFKCMFVFSKDK